MRYRIFRDVIETSPCEISSTLFYDSPSCLHHNSRNSQVASNGFSILFFFYLNIIFNVIKHYYYFFILFKHSLIHLPQELKAHRGGSWGFSLLHIKDAK